MKVRFLGCGPLSGVPRIGNQSLGLRADEDKRSVIYAIDFNDMKPAIATLYEAADVWICAVTPATNHLTHANLDSVLGWARDLRAGQLVLTNLDKRLDYATLSCRLPDWAAPAYDGLELAL